MRSRRRVLSATMAVLAVAMTLAGAAFAAKAVVVKGGSYKGSLTPARDGVLVSFKVSANGKQVTALTITNIPLYCSGGGPPIPIHFKNASISGKGTFSSTGKHVITEGPEKGKVGTTLKITGTFSAGGAERGTLTTTYSGFPSCGGKSSYSAKA